MKPDKALCCIFCSVFRSWPCTIHNFYNMYYIDFYNMYIICIYIYILWEEKDKLQVHPYRPVLRLPTHQGICGQPRKKVCRDELVVYLSFFSHNIYIALLLCIERCFTKTASFRLRLMLVGVSLWYGTWQEDWRSVWFAGCPMGTPQ